jgi:hypothetical protein
MYLLIAVINDETLLDELIMGWLDMGITGATVAETTDLLQLISYHIPIFAGFRALTSGGMRHNKTLFTAIEDQETLDKAVSFLESVTAASGKPHQGVYFVTPLVAFKRLGCEVDSRGRHRHLEEKTGRRIQPPESQRPSHEAGTPTAEKRHYPV